MVTILDANGNLTGRARLALVLVVGLILALHAPDLMAGTTAPTTGDFYDIYDRFMHNWMGKSLGWLVVGVSILYGVTMLVRGSWVPAVVSILAGVLVLKLESVVAGLAFTI